MQEVVNDTIVTELNLIYRVHFYVCEQCAPRGDKEWCRPGADAEGYSQADGNLRISPPPSGRLPQVMLRADHLKLLRDEVGYNVQRRVLDHDSDGYRGYWEVIRWAGRDFRTIFKYKSFAFGLRCPTGEAIQWVKSPFHCHMVCRLAGPLQDSGESIDKSAVRFGTWDLFHILRDAIFDLELEDDPDILVSDREEGKEPLFVPPFEGTTFYDPHGVFTKKGDKRGTEYVKDAESPGRELRRRATLRQVSPRDRKPITLHWAIWGLDRHELLKPAWLWTQTRRKMLQAASTFHPCRHCSVGLFTLRSVGEDVVIYADDRADAGAKSLMCQVKSHNEIEIGGDLSTWVSRKDMC